MSWLPRQRVVVPVDFSRASLNAVAVASELVSNPSRLHVLHVTQPLHVAEPGMVWGTMSDGTRLEMANAALHEHLTKLGLHDCDAETVLGLPAHEIADYARRVAADLIVMPSHGRSGLQRFFLGSVTEKVLRLSDCPVLVLRVRDEDEG